VYEFMEQEKANHRVATMCRVLGVSTSGYYAWHARPPSQRAVADRTLIDKITAIHTASRGTYGAPRVHVELREDHDVRCGCKRVARLMRKAGLQGVHRRRLRGLTKRDREAVAAPDLVERRFEAAEPNRLWVADITYVATWAGFVYLAVVLDAFSRKVVGWSIRNDLTTQLVLDALDMAIWRRRPGEGLVHHSDQGCQYTSLAFGRRCRQAEILPSMGSVGDAFDNAMAESFFASLECELLDRRRFRTKGEARLALFDYIECFYNRRRRHSSLGYLSPDEFERRARKEDSESVTLAVYP
jgi:putative transposase